MLYSCCQKLDLNSGAEEGAVREGGGHLGVRGDPLHPARGLPALLGRGPAPAVRADQGRRLRLPVARVGHGDARGQEPHQSDADGQPGQEDQVGRGAQTPLDLRECIHYT